MSPKVKFKKSNKVVDWDNSLDSLLDLAEEHGASIESECRQGYCGTCKIRSVL